MSLAENLLNSLDETAYQNSRIAGIEPEEEHIKVGQDRVITVPNVLKTIAVKGDKDVETATIDCVRYWDGNDLSTFAIYLNYILPNGDEGTYIPESIKKSEDFFSFDWEIGSEFTYAQGKLTFWIVTKLTDDNGELVKQWSSFQNSDCTIAQGGDKIYVPEKQTDQDVISQAISISRSSAEIAEEQANLAKEAAEKAATDAKDAAEDEVSRIIGELGVVQELGDSPNSVVSQLKVTKEFNQTNAKVNRNSKRITNLEKGLTPDPFETDDTVAYQKYVPENALPYAEVNKIGGMSRKCPNLIPYPYIFGSSNTIYGVTFTANSDGSITVNGTANAYTWRTISNVNIPVGTYNMSANSNAGSSISGVHWYLYNSSENFKISQIAGSTITTNNQEYSVVMAIDEGTTLNNVTFKPMLNPGSTKLPYEPYYAGLRDAKVTEVKSKYTLPIPAEVQALNGYGLGISDTIYNYIDWENKQFVKRVVVVDTGTLDWIYDTNYSVFWAGIPNGVYWDGYSLMSKYQLFQNASELMEVDVGYTLRNNFMGTQKCGIMIKDSSYTDVETFKAAMSGVMLVYELATPEVTDISDLITADNLIGVEGNGTITFENEYGYAVPSEVTYQLKGATA